MIKKVFALILAFGLFNGGVAQAFDWFGGRLSIGGGYGYAKPKLPYTFQDAFKESRMWTANAKYFLSNDVSIVASYADLQAKSRTSPDDIHFRPLIGSLRYNIFHHLPFTPYLTAGAGVGFNRKENANGTETKWTKLALQGGLGLEFFINEHTSFGAEALYHNFMGENNTVPYRLVSAAGMVNIYFGDGPETRRIREEAARQKARADQAEGQALTAQQTAAAAALAAQAEADRKTREMQAQTAQAQAELDAIKQMIARKDLPSINFKTGSAELLDESHAALNKIVETAKKYPNLKLRVEGHTDSQGSDSYNLNLSQERADSVRNYLVRGGVSADQAVAVGFGESRPIEPNETVEGRAQNRRVEFIFFLK